MRYIQGQGAAPRSLGSGRRAFAQLALATMVACGALLPALADPPTPGTAFAHKYIPSYANSIGRESPELTVVAPSLKTLVATSVGAVPPGRGLQKLPGGIHQAETAVVVGAAAGWPVRFQYGPGDHIILQVGEEAVDTGLSVAQARPMASFVARRNNGLIDLNGGTSQDGGEVYWPKVAGPYIDTAEGYWLLWADAIAGDRFLGAALGNAPDGLTIGDSEQPVTIDTDGGLKVHGGEPRVALWKRLGGKRATFLDYRDFAAIEARDRGDHEALAAVRRVFKWAPVMRLAAGSDPVAFRSFVDRLERARIVPVPTPRRLEARLYR